MREGASIMRVALVVGASSGLGYAIAGRLSGEGMLVYAAARSFGADRQPPPGCKPITLDVNDEASVCAAVGQLSKEEGHIDILVNCAAQIMLGAFEEIAVNELRAVMETNFFGMVRVTQAVLPIMRAQGAGRIIQLSSLNGLMAIPFQGAYTASKHALEGFNEALAMEVRNFGVYVTMIEPGDCSGGSDAYRIRAKASENESSPYNKAYTAAVSKIHWDESHGQNPERVARAVLRAIRRKHPPVRIIVARIEQRLAVFLHDLFPSRIVQRIITSHYTPNRK